MKSNSQLKDDLLSTKQLLIANFQEIRELQKSLCDSKLLSAQKEWVIRDLQDEIKVLKAEVDQLGENNSGTACNVYNLIDLECADIVTSKYVQIYSIIIG